MYIITGQTSALFTIIAYDSSFFTCVIRRKYVYAYIITATTQAADGVRTLRNVAAVYGNNCDVQINVNGLKKNVNLRLDSYVYSYVYLLQRHYFKKIYSSCSS